MKMKALVIVFLLFVSFAISVRNGYAQQPQLEQVFTDNTYQLTGVAVSKTGRMFINYPLWSKTYKYAVVEVMPDGTTKPYPNLEMNSWKAGQKGLNKWVCVQAVYIDDDDYLYVVDPAAPKLGPVYQSCNKVVKIDLRTNKIEHTYTFYGVADQNSYINDIRVDVKKQMAFLSNSKEGGIIVLNLQTGKSRQVLQGHKSVLADPNFKFIIDGKELKKNGKPAKFNSDGIALTPDGEWLYYKPLSDKKVYRIKTKDLANKNLTSQQLQDKVEELGEVATTDGMIFDKRGNLYMGDLQNHRLLQITPDYRMNKWIVDKQLIWPDSYSIANGYLYVTTSQIQKQPDFNNGVNKRTSPYAVYKVKLP